ncbi:hypothetical protein [Stratiformator vulcanicus]|nr:hypothetical protein [Stratiformator vulcanicus]
MTDTLEPKSLVEDIERHVRLRTGSEIQQLRITVDEERVVLEGCTTTFYNKQLAGHAAHKGLQGRSLANNICVN